MRENYSQESNKCYQLTVTIKFSYEVSTHAGDLKPDRLLVRIPAEKGHHSDGKKATIPA